MFDAQLHELREQVQQLARRVAALEAGVAMATPTDTTSTMRTDAAEQGWSWLAHSAALRRVAMISFVLVIALVLRTLTDGGIVEPTLGVWLGVGYAVLLMLLGWRRLARDRSGQRVFPVCGAVLLCALVLETHARFVYLGAAAAHTLLVTTLLASAALGLAYRAPLVVEAGVLTATTTTIVIGFPVPQFQVAAVMLVLAMLAATAIAGLRRAPWLHWATLNLLLFFWMLWAIKLGTPLARGEALDDSLFLSWYLPLLASTFVVLLGIAWRQTRTRPGAFALSLPTVDVAFAFAAAGAVVGPWLAGERALGAVALSLAALLLGMSTSLLRRSPTATAPITAFAIAAIVAFVPGSWLLTGNLLSSLPAWAIAALLLARWSGTLGSAGMRLAACGLQVGTTLTAIAGGVFATPISAPWSAAAVGALLAIVGAAHYRWTRRTPVPAGSWLQRLSPTDRTGIATLWTSVAAVFCCLRVVTWQALATMPIDVDNAFSGAQSVLFNLIAMTLLVLAQRARSRPLLAAAVLVATIAGGKVFASDFLTLHGVPLVLGVFSFGLTAAVGSVMLGRWQHSGSEPADRA